jgi:hypothetical protein
LEGGVGLEDVNPSKAIAYLRGSFGRAQTGSKKASKTMVRITKSLNGGNIAFLFYTSEVATRERTDAKYVEFGFDTPTIKSH